jgi:hypothetical protein
MRLESGPAMAAITVSASQMYMIWPKLIMVNVMPFPVATAGPILGLRRGDAADGTPRKRLDLRL